MTDEIKLQIATVRATRAKNLIEDELFQDAFRGLEAEYTKAIISSEAHESRKRENLYQAIQILGDIRNHFGKILSDGRVAKVELDQLANRKRPKVA